MVMTAAFVMSPSSRWGPNKGTSYDYKIINMLINKISNELWMLFQRVHFLQIGQYTVSQKKRQWRSTL